MWKIDLHESSGSSLFLLAHGAADDAQPAERSSSLFLLRSSSLANAY